jgi:AcrR family transcriptional regulator
VTKTTRELLLDAAAELLRAGGVPAVTMVAVAKGADVSRQAAYLHFEDRGELLVALVDRIDREHGLFADVERVRKAPTAAAAIEAAAEMQARHSPRIVQVARALDALRHEDDAAARAWSSRIEGRLAGARAIVDRLAASGGLHRSRDREEAAVLLCELLSVRVWDDLVNQHGLSAKAYVRLVTSTALATLATRR